MAKSNVAEIHATPRRDPKTIDTIDELSMLLAHLSAQLAVIHAQGFESFNKYCDEIKDNYIWAMYCEAERAQELCKSL
jgi:hypothetical protein